MLWHSFRYAATYAFSIGVNGAVVVVVTRVAGVTGVTGVAVLGNVPFPGDVTRFGSVVDEPDDVLEMDPAFVARWVAPVALPLVVGVGRSPA
jgi:hypothetical protein